MNHLLDFQNIEINDRDDYYGGDVKGRSKLLKEIIEILKEEAQDKMAVAVRFSPDEKIKRPDKSKILIVPLVGDSE